MPKSLVFIIPFTFLLNSLKAQNLEAGLMVGLTTYNGDIHVNANNLGSALRPAIGLLGKYRLSNSILLRGQVLTGKIAASEKNQAVVWRRERGFAFQSQLTEISGLLEWEFATVRRTSFFAFGGVGAAFFNPKTDYNEPNPFITTDINTDSKATYSKITPSIPLGLGVKYALKNNFNLSFEVGYRKTFTDYLDGISKIANPSRKDVYFITAIALTKSFGNGKTSANRFFKSGGNNCPTF